MSVVLVKQFKREVLVCLMRDKVLVRECLESLQSTNITTSIKCRIGLGKNFNYDFFEEFIDEVLKSGIKIVYVHARNAILSGISPSQNRTVPPLNYEFVKKLVKDIQIFYLFLMEVLKI